MSKKDPLKSRNYIIKTKDGFIVAIEGKEDTHLREDDDREETRKAIREIKRLLGVRQKAGFDLSKLFKTKLGLTAVSISSATHTTGAGDYDEQGPKK